MRHGAAGRRSRNRSSGGGRKGNQNRMQVFDSNGPDVRIRGTAHQICEKYLALAKDSAASGDRILSESYMQHAEHYQRIINEWNEVKSTQSRPSQDVQQEVDGNRKDADADDDLGLPSSITGKEQSQKSEQKQPTLENA